MNLSVENRIAQPVGTTLERYIMRKQAEFPFATGELSQLLRDIALAGKIVNREVNRAGLTSIIGAMGQQNVQGEAQQKLDVEANIRFIRALTNGGEACAVLSEEEDDIIHTGNCQGKYVAVACVDDVVHTGNCQGKYVVAIDPLDGSSNIDVNISIGTIFSIYRRVTPVGEPATATDFLQGGRRQVAAGYILYGSSTMLVYTTGHGVAGFTYEQSLGEFFLSHPSITIPATGNVFSCNEGYWFDYPEYVREYLTECKRQGQSGRYVGSLVADYHRNLLTGGIYLYPPTGKNPQGKLRVLYEAFPLAYLIEQAGGRAETGTGPVLDIEPTDFHQRSPLFVGSPELVAKLLTAAEPAA